MEKVKHYGYFLTIEYVLYLGFLTFYPIRRLMQAWLGWHSLLKLVQMIGLWRGDFKTFLKEYFNIWTVLELLRLVSLLVYIVYQEQDTSIENHSDYKTNAAVFVTTISWFLLTDRLSIFDIF
jgi:hypothetical protein